MVLKDEFFKQNRVFIQSPSKNDHVRYLDLSTLLTDPSERPVSDNFMSASLLLNNSGNKKQARIIGKVVK